MNTLTNNEKTVLCYMVCNSNAWCESINFNNEWDFGEDYFEGHITVNEIVKYSGLTSRTVKGVIGSLCKKKVIYNIGENGNYNGFYFYKETFDTYREELKDTMNEMIKNGVKFEKYDI